jgi:hypothetical protein
VVVVVVVVAGGKVAGGGRGAAGREAGLSLFLNAPTGVSHFGETLMASWFLEFKVYRCQ